MREIWICEYDASRDIMINKRLENGSYERYLKKDTSSLDIKISKITDILERLELDIPIKVINKIPPTD